MDSCCSSFGKTAAHEIRATLEKFTANGLPWEGPHSIAEEIPLSLSKQKMMSSDKLTKTPTLCLPALSMGKREGLGGKKDVLKAYITSHYPPLTLVIINLLYTFKFQLVLPLKYFLPVIISTHEPFTRFFSLSSAQLRAREGEWMAFVNAWHLARVKPQHVAPVSIQRGRGAAVLAAGSTAPSACRLRVLQWKLQEIPVTDSLSPSKILTVEALKYLTFTLFQWVTLNYLRISTLIAWPSQQTLASWKQWGAEIVLFCSRDFSLL